MIVERKMYLLSEEAMEFFESLHDSWELEVCKKYPHNVLIAGNNYVNK